jgi:hypothetical protein
MIKSRRMIWAGYVTRMGEKGNVYKVSVGKPDGKALLERTRSRWKYNIKMDIKGDWMGRNG